MSYIDNVKQYIKDTETLCGIISKDGDVVSDNVKTLQMLVRQIGLDLYHTEFSVMQKCMEITDQKSLAAFIDETEKMFPVWQESIKRREKCAELEDEFWDLYDYLKYCDPEIILAQSIERFKALDAESKSEIENGIHLGFLTGIISEETEDYSLIEVCVKMMTERVEDILWLFSRLCDFRSRYTLIKILYFYLGFDLEDLMTVRERVFCDYYDLDIIPDATDAVLVDCGAFVGDSILWFVKSYGDVYKRIYAYEIVEDTFKKLVKFGGTFRDVIPRQAGVAGKKGTMYIDDDSHGFGARLAGDGKVAVDVVTLDEDVKEPIDFIKMDIEGAELSALLGSREHIMNEKPNLLISAYHNPADIVDIPRLIDKMRDDYKFYLRYNGTVPWPADFVLLAVR